MSRHFDFSGTNVAICRRLEALLDEFGIIGIVWVTYNAFEIRTTSPCPTLFPVLRLYFPETIYERPHVAFLWEGPTRRAVITVKRKPFLTVTRALRDLENELAPKAGTEETQAIDTAAVAKAVAQEQKEGGQLIILPPTS